MPEVGQRSEAGPDVIQREAAAEGLDAVGEVAQRFDRRRGRGLGDLEGQKRRVGSGLGERLRDHVGQGPVGDRRR